MARRYGIRPDGGGAWAVIDRFTGIPAVFEGLPQVGLSLEEAFDLMKFMNELDTIRRAKGLPEGGNSHGGGDGH